MLLRSTTFERNWSSSPLYAIHPGRTIVIQPVGFNSYSFTDVTCQIEPDGEHPTSRERFILPIKPARSREFNPFHRKHHKASNTSSERRSNKTVFGGCFQCSASPLGKVLLLLPESRNDWIRTNDTCALQDVRPLHHACGMVSR